MITWSSDYGDGSGMSVWRKVYNSGGGALYGDDLVNSSTAGNQAYSAATAADSDGNYLITWSSLGQDGSSWGIYGQKYNVAGGKIGTEFRINTVTAGEQSGQSVAYLIL